MSLLKLTARNVKRVAVIGLLLSMMMTLPLWMGNNDIIPFAYLKTGLYYPLYSKLLFGGIVCCSILLFFFPQSWTLVVGTVFFLALSLSIDLNRAQVWLLHFLFLLILPNDLKENECRFAVFSLMAITYFFSGLNKLNPSFAEETLPWLVAPFGFMNFPISEFVLPVFEIFIAFLLLVPSLSQFGNAAGVLMHGMIIYILIYYQWNLNVLPWNLVLILLHFLLIVKGIEYRQIELKIFLLPGIFLVVAVLGYAGIINRSFSFPLYAGDLYSGIVIFSDSSFQKLPPSLRTMSEKLKSTQEHFINLDRFSLTQLQAPLFQDVNCFKATAKYFIRYTKNDDDLILLIRKGAGFQIDKDLWAITLRELQRADPIEEIK